MVSDCLGGYGSWIAGGRLLKPSLLSGQGMRQASRVAQKALFLDPPTLTLPNCW